ncbi:protein-glucosylgalactosylhydroxylysine glucosidase [Bombina bombina]|uniref:protein-glucosylgalactosylhydroxylysine glucosidase n=1 Tax=Bombina bombina TaxID=8345 RepID=UPI00235A761B|nr:protein-glucosylgalactosylhydroxylysine glucosidase [Bombina bombina]
MCSCSRRARKIQKETETKSVANSLINLKAMSSGNNEPWIFITDSLPSDPRLMATVANGYLGSRVFSDVLHVNGVYNGSVGDCHRADVPSPLNVRLCPAKEEIISEKFLLNTKTGTFNHILECSSFTATQQIFAHRSHTHLLVNIITIKRTRGTDLVTLNLRTSFKVKSEDLRLQRGQDFHEAEYIYGSTLIPEVKSCPLKSVHMIWTPVPKALTLLFEQENSWVFLTSVSESEEDVKEKYVEGLILVEEKKLYSSHEKAWADILAESSIEVEGSVTLQKSVYGCLFYLLSSLPPLGSTEEFSGISPGGLSNGRSKEDYWGHIFWDQDTWIYPNIVLLYPEMARHILRYRIRTLGGAVQNAQEKGYKGAKYPWESAMTGYEVCPEQIYGEQEIHINGDVLMAFKQYYYMTQDLDLFASAGGWDVVRSIADYWCSRVVWSTEENCYHLKGVMPPDEYHSDIDNSAYTNVLVQLSLNFAIELAMQLYYPIPDEWTAVSSKIKIPYDPKLNYHPEYDGYEKGQDVKQADVVLLGYPVMFPMTPEQRKNDLDFYTSVTDPDGPAMTWSMFAIGWMELKQTELAEQEMKKCFTNITEPFKIWTENADGSGAVNFLTGMGGFLQAVLFGYSGFRITKNSLNFDPICSEDFTKLHITGVCYRGNKLNFIFTKEKITVELTSVLFTQSFALEITFGDEAPHIPLYVGKPVSFAPRPGRIQLRRSCWPL